MVNWNSSDGSQETKVLGESLLMLKEVVMKLVLVVVVVIMMWVLVLLERMEEIGVVILEEMEMVGVGGLGGSPGIRERNLGTAIRFAQ